MDRKDFIKTAGMGAFLALSATCPASCTKMENPQPPVDAGDGNTGTGGALHLELDLTKPAYVDLQNAGGYVIIQNKWVVACKTAGVYIAASRLCTDADLNGIVWDGSEWLCVEHQATYSEAGTGTTTFNNLGANGIEVYTTEVIGNILHVYG